MQLGNGRWESTVFNSRLQPTQIALGSTGTGARAHDLLKLDYSYGGANNNGNVLSQTITVPAAGQTAGFVATQVYTYDPLNRIKQAAETIPNQAGWQQTFVYDRYGNRNFDEANTTTLLKNCMEGATPVVCAADVPVVNPSVDVTNNRLNGYGFDASGNTRTDAESRTFVYDSENKQAEVRDQANTIVGRYFYNGDGQRIKKVVPSTGETTVFVYDASNKLVAEYSTVVEPPATAKTSYLTSDHLGSPRILTDQNGATISRRDFHPFGEEISAPERTVIHGYQPDAVRQKFTGKDRDGETELDYFTARYLSSSHGRFSSPDPAPIKQRHLLNPQDLNRYLYVANNPLVFIDPDGEEKIRVIVRTFIPQKYVRAPHPNGIIRKFEGDNRDAGKPGTSRTEQIVTIETDPRRNGGSPMYGQPIRNTGVTREIGWLGVYENQSSGETLKATVSRDKNVVTVQAEGNESNPLIMGAPGITYDLKIGVQSEGADGNLTVTVNGDHDGFPAYEVLIVRPETGDNTERLVFSHDPRTTGQTAGSLIPPMEFKANSQCTQKPKQECK